MPKQRFKDIKKQCRLRKPILRNQTMHKPQTKFETMLPTADPPDNCTVTEVESSTLIRKHSTPIQNPVTTSKDELTPNIIINIFAESIVFAINRKLKKFKGIIYL